VATARQQTTDVELLTPEEARAVFDYQARQLVGLSGDEFMRRWNAGEFHEQFDLPGHEDLTQLVMLMPLACQEP
jgi:hypothetical protein